MFICFLCDLQCQAPPAEDDLPAVLASCAGTGLEEASVDPEKPDGEADVTMDSDNEGEFQELHPELISALGAAGPKASYASGSCHAPGDID